MVSNLKPPSSPNTAFSETTRNHRFSQMHGFIYRGGQNRFTVVGT